MPPSTAPRVDVVVPAYNEAGVLRSSVRTLHAYLASELSYRCVITIAESGSTDGTAAVAADLARRLERVRVLSDPARGRGLALRNAWASSDAEVVAYIDADLSIGLEAFRSLLAPVVAGRADLSVGSRHLAGSNVVRSLHRAFLSRSLNLLLRVALGARFTDAQCGFKAGRRETLAPVMAEVRADHWFFDTELLVLAQRHGLRIHEVPVDCLDDPRSSVDVVPTAVGFLREIVRLARDRRSRPATRAGAIRA
ncbi:glycosyltransferase [Isoptericola sp. b515]|uniref:glycosyltransferase n=1 Tax=Isoptericola sp. b515 TaxID=3064652 RepID=UPI002713B119|nr:glycosyltransferase [Isoptericola sp. b515]MDO8147738.1 glycosyltransferase [Isoptericola sp. b515]